MADQHPPISVLSSQSMRDAAESLAVYAGCWIALVDGQVAGVGQTEEAARLAARSSRPRERIAQIYYISPAPSLVQPGDAA